MSNKPSVGCTTYNAYVEENARLREANRQLRALVADLEGRQGFPWPVDRREELERLQDLLREVQSINTGNYCLERIAKCIALAQELDRTDYQAKRVSFIAWLNERATP